MIPQLILASTSPYRKALLERLRLPFEAVSPETDETPLPGESPEALSRRLSEAKARAVAASRPGAFVIGSDQVAVLDGRSLGKPGTKRKALAMLKAMAGREVLFHTAVTLVAPDGSSRTRVDTVRVVMKDMPEADYLAYVEADDPVDCAGAAKIESQGVKLVSAVHSDDPTSLVGLPLIAVCEMLEEAGFPLFARP